MIDRIRGWFAAAREENTVPGGLVGTETHPAQKFRFLRGSDPNAVFGNIVNNFGLVVCAATLVGGLPLGVGVGALMGLGTAAYRRFAQSPTPRSSATPK